MPAITVPGCDWCNRTVAPEELGNYLLDGRTYSLCPTCVEPMTCSNCEQFYGRGMQLTMSYTLDRLVCDDCNPDEICSRCDANVAEGSLVTAIIDGEEARVCRSCLPNVEEYVESYSYKPDPIFHGDYDTEDEVHLGLELEFYAPDQGDEHQKFLQGVRSYRKSWQRIFYSSETCRMRLNNKARFYFKWDSSLRTKDYGIEFVTHPHTLAEHRVGILPFINDVFKEHCMVDKTCGIHVHIDKARMTYLDRAKMHTFLLCNQADVCSLAGRHNEDYAPFRRRGGSVTLKQQLQGHEERHTFLNHRPKNTAEMRIFSSSVEPMEVLAYLEFAHALLFFSKKHVLRECTDNASWSRFVAFVKERPQYSELVQLLQEKGLDGVGTCQLAFVPWHSKFAAQITGNDIYDLDYNCPYCDDTGCPDCADYDFGEEPEY